MKKARSAPALAAERSKLAACELQVVLAGQPLRTLRSKHRAAFEILTERGDHGIAVVA
jgi:hypothetical protein